MRPITFMVVLAISCQSPAFEQKDLNNEMVIAANWQQLSGEYEAYLHQTFNGALDQLDQALKKVPEGKKPAIITDIDDTLISGITYFTSLTGTHDNRSIERLRHWWTNSQAEALPGAVSFLQAAHREGVELFYISDRFDDVKPATIKNLKQLGFPVTGDDFVMLQPALNKTLSKEQKRQHIQARGYHPVMILGDQLDDLADVPPGNIPVKSQWVSSHQRHFGTHWYFLPNTLYGSWEAALVEGYEDLSPKEKHKARINALPYNEIYRQNPPPDYSRHLLQADVWLQTSADFQATAFQTYNQAVKRLSNEAIRNLEHRAIILDIDGTLLEYFPIHTGDALTDHSRSPQQKRQLFEKLQNAKPVPGALAFTHSAASMGYTLFYVTSRDRSSGVPGNEGDLEQITLNQLIRYGFPMADREHLLTRQAFCPDGHKACGKEYKRQAITGGRINNTPYQVVLYVGDLLADFDLVEQGLSPWEKSTVTLTHSQYGRRLFVIPNPVNKTWMMEAYSRAAQRDAYQMTNSELAKTRESLVRDWPGKNQYRQKNQP